MKRLSDAGVALHRRKAVSGSSESDVEHGRSLTFMKIHRTVQLHITEATEKEMRITFTEYVDGRAVTKRDALVLNDDPVVTWAKTWIDEGKIPPEVSIVR